MLNLKEGTILKVIKPLYSIPKASNYWFSTYYRYYTKKLRIVKSIYNPCLLYYYDANTGFGLVSL